MQSCTSLDKFFYPLDAVHDWNKIYGDKGMLQFQCLLPNCNAEENLARIFEVCQARRIVSFVTVLKKFGKSEACNKSFPREGYTLAMDFPRTQDSLILIRDLHDFVIKCGGDFYLAKEACLTKHQLKKWRKKFDSAFINRSKKFDSYQSVRLDL